MDNFYWCNGKLRTSYYKYRSNTKKEPAVITVEPVVREKEVVFEENKSFWKRLWKR